MDSVDLASFLSILILITITPLSICWLWSFYLLRNTPEIAARRPYSSILVGALCIGGTIFGSIILLIYNSSIITRFPYAVVLTNSIALVVYVGPYHLFTYRAYMVFFDICWNKAMEHQSWRLYIDPNETNWFLKHRSTWGSKNRIAALLFTHFIIWLIIIIVLSATISPQTVKLFMGATGMLPLLCDFILYLKWPKFDDFYFISNEIKLTLRFELTLIISWYLVASILKAKTMTVEYTAIGLIPAITDFIFSIIINYYPLKKFNLPTTPCCIKRYFSSNVRQLSISTETDQECNKDLPTKTVLRNILADKNGFNEFATHLTKEYSLENLIFFVETQQWLQKLAENESYCKFIKQEDKENKNKLISLTIHPSAPKSKIVSLKSMHTRSAGTLISIGDSSPVTCTDGVVEMDDIGNNLPQCDEYVQCARLFNKYIANNAYFCINVSAFVRNELYEKFGYSDNHSSMNIMDMTEHMRNNKTTKEELVHIFDAARKSIFQLLLQSVGRYLKTDSYRKLKRSATV